MAEDSGAPHFDIVIEPDKIEVEFYQILEKVRPLWERDDYVYERSPLITSKGLLNTMVKCYSKSNEMDAIMIRIHNVKVNNWIDRSVEIKCLKLLGPLDCAPIIVATFTNGFCYEYYHGEILTPIHLNQEPIWRLIATDLAKFHSSDLNDGSKEKSVNSQKEMFVKIWESYPEELKDPEKNKIFKREFPPIDELKAELDRLIETSSTLDSPIVLCHNDNRAENIIWNEEEQRIHFVDFEMMGYTFQAQEIASHFQRFCGLQPPDYSLMPTEEFQMEWLSYYLKKYYQFTDKNPSDISEKDVRKLYVQVNKFHLLLLLLSAIMGPAFEIMNIIAEDQLDMFKFSLISLKEYRKQKDKISTMKMPE